MWLILVVGISASIFFITDLRIGVKDIADSKPTHFSVVWKGFLPTYSNQTPDYYVCINNLQAGILQMYMALKIQNFENRSFWFMIDQYETPPSGWNVTPYYIGNIAVDTTREFTYSNLTRDKPSSISEGRLTETLSLVVRAYYNDTYTDLYSEANFTVRYHFVDITSTAWTVLYHDNFDDGTGQGWGGSSTSLEWYSRYRSWPCSLVTGNYAEKYFNTNGPYTEVYVILPIWRGGGTITIWLNDQECFQSDTSPGIATWFLVAIPLPVGSTTRVTVQGGQLLDEVYVVAK
jgi:hypothetical protein